MRRRPRAMLGLVLGLLGLAVSPYAAETASGVTTVSPSSSHRPAGPFLALATGHVGQTYSDTTADAFDQPPLKITVRAGTQLPPGLAVDAKSGVISGTPTTAGVTSFELTASTKAGSTETVRCQLAVLSPSESELVAGQSFGTTGPYSVTSLSDSLSWTDSFDQTARSSSLFVLLPQGTPAGVTLPAVVFHYGRGFTDTDYMEFLTLVASHGIVCAAITDLDSFGGTNAYYDVQRPELGMESASGAQEALMDYLLDRAAIAGDPCAVIDPTSIFIVGHSRGGGATHASHVRSSTLRARGVIYLMAFDLRYFSNTVPPAIAPAYSIPTEQSRLPSLIISAGSDGDLIYPYADEFIDRATGPTTFVTVNGACHDFMTDTHPSESSTTVNQIDRATEHAIIASWVVAFIRRWAGAGDVTLDGLLYGQEAEAQTTCQVATWRRVSPLIMVDDFQDSDPTTNLLGGANAAIGLTRTEESAYPAFGDFGSLGIQHSVMAITPGTSSYSTGLAPLGGSLDVSGTGSLKVRVSAPAQAAAATPFSPAATIPGWQIGFWVQLDDALGNVSSVKVANEDGTTLGYLPGRASSTAPMPPCDRFVTLIVPLADFSAANPAIDLTQLAQLDFIFVAAGNSTPFVVADDIRFEGDAISLVAPHPIPSPTPTTPTTVLPAPSPSPSPVPAATALTLVNAADNAASSAPDAMVSALGQSLSRATQQTADPLNLATSLGGTTVRVTDASGTARAAGIAYVSPTQVNFVVPDGTASGTAQVQITSGTGVVSIGTIAIAHASPGIYSADSTGSGFAAGDFETTVSGTTTVEAIATFDASTNQWFANPVDVSSGNVTLVLFATGLRQAQNVTVRIGGFTAPVSYYGPQGSYAGLDQLDVTIPSSLAGQGTVSVQVTADGAAANAVTIVVQ